MGLSEIFVMVASFEYAFFAAPRSAETLFMSLRFFSLGISSFLATGYMAMFAKGKSRLSQEPSMDFRVSIMIKSLFSSLFTLSISFSVRVTKAADGLSTHISLFLVVCSSFSY